MPGVPSGGWDRERVQEKLLGGGDPAQTRSRWEMSHPSRDRDKDTDPTWIYHPTAPESLLK